MSLVFFAVLLAASLWVMTGRQIEYASHLPGPWALSGILLALVGVPAALFIRRLDQFERKPVWLIVAALLWGSVIAIAIAIHANRLVASLLEGTVHSAGLEEWESAIRAPLVEEPLKAAGLFVVVLGGRRLMSVGDGLVCGAAVGLAYQLAENQLYFMAAAGAAPPGGRLAGVLWSFGERVVLGGMLSHTVYTGLVGAGIAYLCVRSGASAGRRLAAAVPLLVIGWGAHFINNSPLIAGNRDVPTSFAFGALATLIVGVLFVVLARRMRERDRAAFRRLVSGAIEAGVLEARDVPALVSRRCRNLALQRAARQGGRDAVRVLRTLQREQIKLVLLQAQPPWKAPDPIYRQRDTVKVLRARLAALPAL